MIEVHIENNKELDAMIDELYLKIGRTYTLLVVRNSRYALYLDGVSP